MNAFVFFHFGNRMLIFFLLRKKVQILKTEYMYGQYCTPLTQSDCRYFFVLAIIVFSHTHPSDYFITFSVVHISANEYSKLYNL